MRTAASRASPRCCESSIELWPLAGAAGGARPAGRVALYGRFRRGGRICAAGAGRFAERRHASRAAEVAADDFRPSLGAAAGSAAAGLGGVGVARFGAGAWRSLLKAGAFAAIALALAQPRAHGLPDQGRGGRAGGHLRQRVAARPARPNRRYADRVERAPRPPLDARHAVRPRHARRAAPDEQAEERLAAAPHRGRRPGTAPIWKPPSATARPRCPPAWCRACC